jgi:hypothetical protein
VRGFVRPCRTSTALAYYSCTRAATLYNWMTTFSVERFTKMAASATSQISTHEQIEYEQGLLLENHVPGGDRKGHTLGLTEDIYADEQRKPPLSAQGRSRTKSAAG